VLSSYPVLDFSLLHCMLPWADNSNILLTATLTVMKWLTDYTLGSKD